MFQQISIPFFGHPIAIYGYGLMLVVAFIACVAVGKWLARRNGVNPELIVNAALIALITGLIGARLCSVLENLGDYTRSDLTVWQNVRNMLNMSSGGLTFYGGFILATPCCIFYAWKNHVPIRLGLDIVAPVLMIGLGIGRVGCFLNGCCYGEQCSWGMSFPYYSIAYNDEFDHGLVSPPAVLLRQTPFGQTLIKPGSPDFGPEARAAASEQHSLKVLPTQLFSTFTGLLLAALLIAYMTLPHIDGRVFALMLILEGAARYMLEIVRVEPAVWPIHGSNRGFSISMILGLICTVAGVLLWWIFGKWRDASRSPAMREISPARAAT